MSEQPTSKRISDLPQATKLNDADLFPISAPLGEAFKSQAATLSALRILFLTDNAVESKEKGIAATSDNQYFYVWSDRNKFFVDEFINQGGVAVPTGETLPSLNAIAHFVAMNKPWSEGINNALMQRDGVPGFLLPVRSANNVTVGFKKSGAVSASHMEIPGLDSLPARDGPLFVPVVSSKLTKRSGIRFYPNTGETGLLLDTPSIDHIKGRLGDLSGGYVPPQTIRGGWQVANVRMTQRFNFATVQERRNTLTFDSKQKASGTITTLIPDSPVPMRARGVMGQSNSVFSGNTPVIESRPLFSFSAFTFDYGSVQQGGSGELDESKLTEFVPLADKPSQTSNQLPATLTAFANEYLKRTMGGAPLGEVVFTAGEGSVAMENLLPGTVNWNNYIKFLRHAVQIAQTYDRALSQRFITLIQGENGNNWSRDYALWADAIIAKIKEVAPATDKTHVLLWQITGGGNGYENGVGTLQLAAADSRADTILIGSMSGFPTVSDNTHLTPEGRMMLAECQAYAERIIEANEAGEGPAWQALRMSSATRNGDAVEISFKRPPGVVQIQHDADFTPPIDQDGYIYANNQDGVIPILQVSYPGNTVLLTLSRMPTPGATGERVSYGLNTRSEAGIGWPWYRGKTMGVTNQRSLFNSLGHNVPEFIRFSLVRERINVGVLK